MPGTAAEEDASISSLVFTFRDLHLLDGEMELVEGKEQPVFKCGYSEVWKFLENT